MVVGPDITLELLRRWRAGERAALEGLLELHLPRLEHYASSKLRAELTLLRREGDAQDLVQLTATKILQYMPAIIPKDGDQFQALLRRFVLNAIRNQARAPRHRLREHSRERFAESVLDLRIDPRSSAMPDRAAEKAEECAFAWLALQFLDDSRDQRLVLLRAVEEMSWEEIGAEVELSADAARMRYGRVLPRLANIIRQLKAGKIDALLEEERTEKGD